MWEPDFTLLGEPIRIPTPEVGAWFPELPPPPLRPPTPPPLPYVPPKRHKPEPVVQNVIPYHERPVVQPKPFDPRSPFRHAGLMRDIGGVQGFMSVVRGTHRYPEVWEAG